MIRSCLSFPRTRCLARRSVGAHGSELAGADDNAAHSLYAAPLTLSIAFVVTLALVTGIPPSGALEALDTVTADGALIYFARDELTASAMDLASESERW